ncbi:MAG: acyl carrier protein [Pseudonocardia sp.]|uniref:phosphopantetheine-binding protein n=1 Tax=unclassified Pseudonocardia TaxID=2619320 RepID=UPI00086A11B7|nr:MULTISPECIES: phosphopantetheine-binding protein [unclassified Pseudonocardia]MBN9110738.1 acyl carrier protein [Pseudonocardia sp.]ODU27116.1 MAG: hypothetical protein ABS80_04540 [Pseudonocardia sp. SCN 72-51]ODV04439.1 MAG: hypothetical protein ABT15_20930 [Pseudonocardia sp. SCN 73-27]
MPDTERGLDRDAAHALVVDVLTEIAPGPELDALTLDEDLREALGLDSLDYRNLVAQVSQRSGRRIEEDDYQRLTNLDGWITFLTES